jgi:hypothetical protein
MPRAAKHIGIIAILARRLIVISAGGCQKLSVFSSFWGKDIILYPPAAPGCGPSCRKEGFSHIPADLFRPEFTYEMRNSESAARASYCRR